jgi:hypothetical protein
VKTEDERLDIEWTLTFAATESEGVIVGGQRDGTEDIGWTFKMSDMQLSQFSSLWGQLAWFGISGTPRVVVGSGPTTNIGDLAGESVRTLEPYVPGSRERTFRINLPEGFANGSVAEILLADTEGRQIGTINFTPPLEKINPYRLFFDVTLSLTDE